MADGDSTEAGERERRRQEILEQVGQMERLTGWIVLVLIGCAIFYAGGVALKDCSLSTFLLAGLLFVALIIAGLAVGGLLGYLFGLPKYGAPGAPARGFFRGNTSLEEISDWLTKIIVGVGLVEAKGIYAAIGDVAWKFQTTALPDVASAGAAFVVFALSALVLGFLLGNLVTRTKLTLLLEDTESARIGPATQDVTEGLDASVAPADVTDATMASATASAPAADAALLKFNYDDLAKPEEFAAWGAAQARAGNFAAAVKALTEAISRAPDNYTYLLRLAEARQAQGDERAAIVLLDEASKKPGADAVDLLKRKLPNALYLAPPEGFRTALQIYDELEKKDPKGAADDASVQARVAAAFGQRYRWLSQNGGTVDELKEARDKALAAVKLVVERPPAVDSAPRKFLRDLFYPTPERPNENDLEVFKDDAEFKAILG